MFCDLLGPLPIYGSPVVPGLRIRLDGRSEQRSGSYGEHRQRRRILLGRRAVGRCRRPTYNTRL